MWGTKSLCSSINNWGSYSLPFWIPCSSHLRDCDSGLDNTVCREKELIEELLWEHTYEFVYSLCCIFLNRFFTVCAKYLSCMMASKYPWNITTWPWVRCTPHKAQFELFSRIGETFLKPKQKASWHSGVTDSKNVLALCKQSEPSGQADRTDATITAPRRVTTSHKSPLCNRARWEYVQNALNCSNTQIQLALVLAQHTTTHELSRVQQLPLFRMRSPELDLMLLLHSSFPSTSF